MLTALRRRLVDSAEACSVNLRSANLRRAQSAFGLIWAGEWAATVAAGVIAFRHGGAGAVGLVGIARMIPAALVAPLAATIADRARRESVLAGVGVVRALTLGVAAAISAINGNVVLVYVALVLATVAQTLFRPAHSALLPTLCSTPTELTTANVVRGLLDSIATLLGPLLAAVLLRVSGPAAVLVAASAASGLAGILVVGVRYETPPRVTGAPAGAQVRQALEGVRAIASDRMLTLLTALATLQTLTRGALTVLSVVVAIKLLAAGAAGVGVLTAAVGAGAIIGSVSAALLVRGRALARWFGIGVALWGAPIALIGLFAHLWSAIVLLAIVGIGNALVDVGVFTLLGRLADDAVLARTFAAFEGIITFGVAVGAGLASLSVSALGIRPTLIAIGLIAPLGVLASWRALRALDHRIRARDVDVALLNHIAMLRPLPTVTIEQLATRLTRARFASGEAVFEQDERGDDFYVIERGRAQVICDGQTIGVLGSGDSFGEIALLRDCRRTAGVRAVTSLTLRALNRTAFVAAVTGYSESADAADRLIVHELSRASPNSAR